MRATLPAFFLMVVGCSSQPDDPAGPDVGGQSAVPTGSVGIVSAADPSPRSKASDPAAYHAVTLVGFECGDNCYVELVERSEGAVPRTFLCTASLCGDWQAAGRLPPGLRRAGGSVRFGRADQLDGAGTVMARDVEAVVDLRLDDLVEGATSGGILPLRPGVYVLAGSDCGSPANAAFRIWTGSGLSGSATRACRAEVTAREGAEFRLNNSCENSYDGSRTAERLRMTVPGPDRFSIDDGAFRLCPDGAAPDYLQRLVLASTKEAAALPGPDGQSSR